MQGIILLNFNENTREVEEMERSRFLRSILEQCFENTDVVRQIQTIWGDPDELLSAQKKIQILQVLTPYGLQVIDDRDGGLFIYLEREIIGKWKKPRYVLKKDPSQLDRRKQFFLEMHIECTSAFDEEATENGS
jgi:hypothetical protein